MLVFFAIVVCVGISASNAQSCTTPSGVQGSCISPGQCNPLRQPVPSSDPPQNQGTDVFGESRCGSDGKVCCPIDSRVTSATNSTVIPDPPDVTNHRNLGLINSPNCGPAASDKVLRGSATTWDEFTWMALLAYTTNGRNNSVFKCGGTLISKRYVLTAAHCVTGLPLGEELSGVRIGEHDLNQKTDCTNGRFPHCAEKYQDFLIESIHPHEEYQARNRQNDIALIRIKEDAVLGIGVATSCLPVGNATRPTLNNGLVAGWGATEKGIRNQIMLRENMAIISNEECTRNLENSGVFLSHKQFCAVAGRVESSCVGDSGGSIQTPALLNENVHYFQYGVVSYGPRQCGTNGPVVYTKVAYYVKWILDTIRE